MVDGACQSVVHSYDLDLHSEAGHQIPVKEFLFDDAYRDSVIDDKKSWFARMEVLDLIYHHFLFIANNLRHQSIIFQYFQHFTLQTVVLTAAVIHCALSEYTSGKKAKVMFSQDEY